METAFGSKNAFNATPYNFNANHKDEKRKRGKMVVEKILEENKKYRTKMGFFSEDPEPEKLTDTVPLKIYPDEIIFKDIKANQTYEINVLVRNLTNKVKRIRVFQPASSKFRCDYDMTGPLAPGIALELIVSFSTNILADYYDEIRIVSDNDYEYKIPLHAYAPCANILFKPFVNLGFVPVGKVKKEVITFENEGSEEGRVELRYNDLPDFHIEPSSSFKIKPGDSHKVTIYYEPKEAGIFRGIIEVFVEGQSFLNSIDVNATSVEFLKFVIDEQGNELTTVDFGEVYFGQKKQLKGFLVNNSPKGFNFRVNFVNGLHQNYDENNYLQTPIEAGLEQTQRVMSISPEQGFIEPYSQLPLFFTCKCRIKEDQKIWVKNNSFVANQIEFDSLQMQKKKQAESEPIVPEQNQISVKDHEYTALINFEGQEESKVLMMVSRSFCPQIKFRESLVNFGECPINDRRDFYLNVYNNHKNLPLLLSCPNNSHFTTSPTSVKLQPGEVKTVTVTFRPQNLGKFKVYLDFLVNKYFQVPIQFWGESLTIGSKPKRVRGLAATVDNFYEQKKEISDVRGNFLTGKNFNRVQKLVNTTIHSNNLPEIYQKSGASEALDAFQMQKFNKQKYTDFLRETRAQRLRSQQKGFVVNQNKVRLDRINLYSGAARENHRNAEKALDSISTVATLGAFEPPKMEIPLIPDTLFVQKPIGDFEPYSVLNSGLAFQPDGQSSFKEFSDKTNSYAELRDCEMDLDGEKLQKIHVWPVMIDFKSIFIKSTAIKYFQVKNELRTSIRVRLILEDEELRASYGKSQIIPSGKVAGFKIVFNSTLEQNFHKPISYIINEKHLFKFMVKANVTLVKLQLKTKEQDFLFQDDNLEMSICKKVKIYNEGNDRGYFSWNDSVLGCFKMEPKSGHVEPGHSKDISITYTPTGNRSTEEETLVMNVVDGMHESLTCKAVLNEVKCGFVHSKINFDTICVNETKSITVSLKNANPKFFAVYEIDENTIPQGLHIEKMRDRIQSEETCRFDVSFCSKEAIQLQDHPVKVRLRGAEPLTLYISVKTIVPEIKILQDMFDFGEVTYGNTGVLEMTIENKSPINAILNLDLRENDKDPDSDGYSKLTIKHVTEKENESIVLEEKDPEELEKNFETAKNMDLDHILDESEDEELAKHPQEEEKSRYYLIKLNKNSVNKFQLLFVPKSHKTYSFYLPIFLNGNVPCEGLSRRVICQGQTPKLIMDPSEGVVVFPRKIITSMDSITPVLSSITLTNMNQRERIKFRLDTTEIDKYEIFSVIPFQGTIDAQAPVTIKVTFKPVGNQKYETELPLYLDDSKKPYTKITLKGEGAYPRLLFDRREVIMPIVPLGIPSICTFRIFNEGYQSLNVKYSIPQDVGSVKLDLEFPDKINLGVNQDRIRVKVLFVSKKAISFTTKIVFEDEQKNMYPIFVSGTCDNSILTNYSFFLAQGNDWEIAAEEKGHPFLVSIANEAESLSTPRNNQTEINVSKAGSVEGKSMKSGVGFAPIPQTDLDRACSHACNWMNEFVLSASMDNFPRDVIASGGTQIYEMLSFLTKKNFGPNLAQTQNSRTSNQNTQAIPSGINQIPYHLLSGGAVSNMNRVEKAMLLYVQYANLIHNLKESGLMLNTIRPEYLLSHQDINIFYKANPNPFSLPGTNKLNESKFRYLSSDAWLTIFYQILKTFYLCRITAKALKSISFPAQEVLGSIGNESSVNPKDPKNPGSKNNTQTGTFGKNTMISIQNMAQNNSNMAASMTMLKSNNMGLGRFTGDGTLYSANECVLLRWIEIVSKEVFSVDRLWKDFEYDMVDGLGVGSLLQKYVGGEKKRLFNLKREVQNDEDRLFNLNKVKEALSTNGIVQMPEILDQKPNAREFILPHYMPRDTLTFPVILGGTCSRNILLENPSKKTIYYWVNLEAHRDFSIDEKQEIKLDPGQSTSFTVKYTARISKQVFGRITFRNKKDTGTQAAALVFDLVSDVQGRNSDQKITVPGNLQLYENNLFEVEVSNPFPSQANFTVKVENIPVVTESALAKKKILKSKKGGKDEDQFFVPSFFCKPEFITIPKNGTYKLPISYLPITLEPHKCYIIFSDENVGEMQYEIIGEPQPPALFTKQIPYKLYLDSTESQFLNVSRRNDKLEFAVMKLKDKLREVRYLESKRDLVTQLEENIENVTYFIECDQPFLQLPNSFQMNKKQSSDQENNHIESKIQDSALMANESSNRIPMNFQYKFPVQNQKVTILLRNDLRTDVRVYEILVTIMPKKVRAILEMTSPARIPLEQDIPVINSLDQPSEIKVTLTKGINGDYFKLPNLQGATQFKAKKGLNNIKLVFYPDWIGESDAKLVLLNKDTNEHFEYDIKGVGEEPLAEEEIIVECKVREAKKVPIKFRLPEGAMRDFEITFDLPNASGPEKFSVPYGSEKEYPLVITPAMGGEFTGSVTFTSQDGVYYWYMVTYRAESTKKEHQLQLESYCRKAVQQEIILDNPFDETIIYKVVIYSDHLFGEKSVTVRPKSTASYILKFSPLTVFREKGHITFLNELVGEVIYDVTMVSEEPPAIKLPTMKEELGKATKTKIRLQNPIKNAVQVVSKVSNMQNFQVYPDKFIIPSGESTEIEIFYIPSDMDSQESAIIIFETEDIGSWTYNVFGIGLPPTKFEEFEISGQLNKECTNTIPFKNPFKDPISVTIRLEAEQDKNNEIFELMLKKPKITVAGNAQTQIPFSFYPKEISEYFAEIVVTMNEKISWRYPIRAVTESISSSVDYKFVIQCHKKKETVLEFNLPGVTNIDPNEQFKLEVNLHNKELDQIAHKWIKFDPEKDTLSNPGESLRYLAKFHPHKPFKCCGDIIISKPAHGGRWKFKANFESKDPEVDEVITITSNLNTTSSVKFKLGLPSTKSATDFIAEFTHDSAPEFSVYPKSGQFNPFNRQDTIFMVSYTPVEYGKIKIGKLVIQTKEYYWNFTIKGTFPKYTPPELQGSKIDNRLNDDMKKKLEEAKAGGQKNFVNKNIQKLNQNPKKEQFFPLQHRFYEMRILR